MALDQNLEQRLGKVANLTEGSYLLRTAQTPDEYANAIDLVVSTASGAQRGSPEYDRVHDRFKGNMGTVANQTFSSQMSIIGKIKDQYDKSKKKIFETVKKKLNEEIKDAKDGYEASVKLLKYFAPLLKIPSIDQAMANDLEREEFAEKYDLPVGSAGVIGSINKAKEIYARGAISELITPNKKGKYTVKEKELNELINNPITGAYLYKKATINKK
jgi:hypothetical protein